MKEKIRYGKCKNCGAKEREENLYFVNKKMLCSSCKLWLNKSPEQKIKEIDKILNSYIKKDSLEVQKILTQRQQICQRKTIT